MSPRANAANLRAVPEAAERAWIYIRQSTFREESISRDLQELACRDYADKRGYVIDRVVDDLGISGRTLKRAGITEVMQAVSRGEVDVVIVWKWSRISRSRLDWALTADRVAIAGGRIESATEPIDTATASGRFARGVMTEYAAFQSEQIGETWEEVRQRRLSRGLPASGRLPFGWQWVDGGITPNTEQSQLVVEMYQRYLSGDGAATIAAWLNTEGVPAPNGGTWARARPLTVMDSPIHAGGIPYRGEVHAGAHEPIIDNATWDAYRAEREARKMTTAKPRAYEHLLSGLMWCGCGNRMHAKGSVTAGHWYGGYLCGARTVEHPERAYVSAKVIDPVVTEWLHRFDPDVNGNDAGDAQKAKRDRLNREINELQTELDNLTRQHAKGIVPEASYVRSAAQISGDMASRDADLRRLRPTSKPMPTREDLATLRGAWKSMTVPAKNKALRQVIARIDLRGDRIRLTTTWGRSSELTL